MTHSQIGQDDWVLTQLGGKRNGTFIDVGAHDGISLSNTLLLEEEYEWTGVCVECHSEVNSMLRINRKCIPVNKAAWSHSGRTMNFHKHDDTMLSGLTSDASTCTVETISLNDIAAHVGTEIDYISLDTEGSEPQILSTFDMTKYNVKCWTIEHNFVQARFDFIANWLMSNGYLIRVVQHDVFAVKDRWQG